MKDTLYIFGNGFDLAHDISTSYWDFRQYLEKVDWQFLYAFEKIYDIEPLDETEYGYSIEAQERWDEAIKELLWSEFERSMGAPSIQSMLDSSDTVVGDLDLETGPIGIKDTMDEYWRSEYGFVDKLQDYVKDWISQIDINYVKPKKEALINSNAYFFNFNYTHILEKVYKIDSVLHIHGSLGDDMPPFMGHCNIKDIKEHRKLAKEANEAFDEGGASIHEAICEYLQAIYKDTKYYISLYDYFFKHLHSVKNIIIIGWSAGEVDIPYLKKIRDSVSKDTKWTVYFYDKTAYDSLQKAFKDTNIIDNYETKFLNSKKFWD